MHSALDGVFDVPAKLCDAFLPWLMKSSSGKSLQPQTWLMNVGQCLILDHYTDMFKFASPTPLPSAQW